MSMSGMGVGVFIAALYLIVPFIVLYFIIKLAVKNAIRELKEEDIF